MDTTFVYNQVAIPQTISAEMLDLPSYPDSLVISIPETVNVVQVDSNSTFLGMPTDVAAIVFPTVVPIIVFSLGLIFNWLEKKWRSRTETIEYRKTVFTWCTLVEKPARRQVEGLNKLSEDIEKNKTIQGVQYEFSKSMVNHLDVASADKVIKHFINRSKAKTNDKRAEYAYNMVSLIDFLQSVEHEIDKQYDSYLKQSIALFPEWNKEIMNIKDNLNADFSSSREKLMLHTLKQFYVKWCDGCVDDVEVDVLKVRDLLLIPIVKSCNSQAILGQGFDKIESIYKSAMMLLTTIKKWVALNEGFKNVFKAYAQSESKSIDSLMEAVDYFKNNTKPMFWV